MPESVIIFFLYSSSASDFENVPTPFSARFSASSKSFYIFLSCSSEVKDLIGSATMNQWISLPEKVFRSCLSHHYLLKLICVESFDILKILF